MPIVLVVPVAAVVAAILAVLVLLAAPAVTRLFHAVFDGIPLVGGYIATAADAAISAATSTLKVWAQEAALALGRVVYQVVMLPWNVVNNAVDAVAGVTAALGRVAANIRAELSTTAGNLQANINATWTDALNWVRGAEAIAAADLAATARAITADLSTAEANLQANINAVYDAASGWVATAEALAEGEFASAMSHAESLFATAEGDITAATAATMGAIGALAGKTATEIAGAEQHAIDVAGALASQAATGAVDALDSAAHDVVIGPWSALLPQLGAIIEHLPADVAQAIPGLSTIPRDLPLTLPAILGVLAPAITATTTEVARCTVPMCENLGGLSNLFGQLAGDAFWALLIALVAESVANPHGAVEALTHDVAPAMGDVAHGVMGLVGV